MQGELAGSVRTDRALKSVETHNVTVPEESVLYQKLTSIVQKLLVKSQAKGYEGKRAAVFRLRDLQAGKSSLFPCIPPPLEISCSG